MHKKTTRLKLNPKPNIDTHITHILLNSCMFNLCHLFQKVRFISFSKKPTNPRERPNSLPLPLVVQLTAPNCSEITWQFGVRVLVKVSNISYPTPTKEEMNTQMKQQQLSCNQNPCDIPKKNWWLGILTTYIYIYNIMAPYVKGHFFPLYTSNNRGFDHCFRD